MTLLLPGYIRSELAGEWFESDLGRRQMATWPRRRLLEEGALDANLLFLMSDESAGVTGSEFVIDDGQSL